MAIASQKITGSIQSVLGTDTTECPMKKDVKMNKPRRIALGGKLMLFPNCSQPCVSSTTKLHAWINTPKNDGQDVW